MGLPGLQSGGVQLGLQSLLCFVQIGFHTHWVGLPSSGVATVQLGLLLGGLLLQLGMVQLGFLHCTSVQLGSLGTLSQLGNVGQIGSVHCTSVQFGSLGTLSQLGTVHHDCLHCSSVQLGSYWALFLGNLGLIWGFY